MRKTTNPTYRQLVQEFLAHLDLDLIAQPRLKGLGRRSNLDTHHALFQAAASHKLLTHLIADLLF